jgi:CheY-like chemotaxis protein
MLRLSNRSILVLERDATDAYGLRTVLEATGAEIAMAFDAGEALVRLSKLDFDIAVLDGIDCADVCRRLGGVPFVFYVGRKERHEFPDWPHAPVIVKPAAATVIVETIAKLMK